jgi:NAD-dependent dihydropyrimidine dehydrogenase PreA subunit
MGKPKIKIDYNKCKKPENCRKCLPLCSPGVFNLIFTDKDYHIPKNWKIIPVFRQLCTTCLICVNECPEKAISVKK